MAIDSVIHTNRHSIDRVLNAGVPVAIIFWDQASPILARLDGELEKYAKQYAGKALIAKVDARDESDLLRRFQVAGLPAIVYIKDGKVVERSGADSEPSAVGAWLAHLTNGAPRPVHRSPAAASPQSNGSRASSYESAGYTSGPTILTDANFAQVTAGNLPVLVDFWAPWCGPCRMVAPSVEQLAREFSGRAVIGKLNVDENPATAGRFNIMSIPTLLILKQGAVVDQIVGAQPLDVLRRRLARHA